MARSLSIPPRRERGRQKCPLWTPTCLESPSYCPQEDAEVMCQMGLATSDSGHRKNPVVSLVHRLLGASGPATIGGAVISIIIDPLKHQAGGRISHVGQKVCEGAAPASAHRDSTAPIIGPAGPFGIRASRDHAAPHAVRSAVRTVFQVSKPAFGVGYFLRHSIGCSMFMFSSGRPAPTGAHCDTAKTVNSVNL
jgi:hypothetical protein